MKWRSGLREIGRIFWLALILIQLWVAGMILKLTWAAYTNELGYGQWIACGDWNSKGEGLMELWFVIINAAFVCFMIAYWAFSLGRRVKGCLEEGKESRT